MVDLVLSSFVKLDFLEVVSCLTNLFSFSTQGFLAQRASRSESVFGKVLSAKGPLQNAKWNRSRGGSVPKDVDL